MKICAWMLSLIVLAAAGCKLGAKYTVGGIVTGLSGTGLVAVVEPGFVNSSATALLIGQMSFTPALSVR